MDHKRYDISMSTPIGKKRGYLTVNTENGVVTGELEVMKHSEPFRGVIDGDGNCLISGSIVTLMRTVKYTAVGIIKESTVELRVTAANHTFEVRGEATA